MDFCGVCQVRGNRILDHTDLLDVDALPREPAFSVLRKLAGLLQCDELANAKLNQMLAHMNWNLQGPNPWRYAAEGNKRFLKTGCWIRSIL